MNYNLPILHISSYYIHLTHVSIFKLPIDLYEKTYRTRHCVTRYNRIFSFAQFFVLKSWYGFFLWSGPNLYLSSSCFSESVTDSSVPVDAGKPRCSLASLVEKNWTPERYGFSVVNRAPKDQEFLEEESAICHRRLLSTVNSVFEKPWCTLVGYSACAPRRFKRDFDSFCNFWIYPRRTDWWRISGKCN